MTAEWYKGLERFVDLHPAGAGDPAVREAMIGLLVSYSSDNQPGIDGALSRLAAALNRPLDDIKAEFERFRQLATQPPSSYANFRPTYIGSLQHLRYGQLIAEVTGLSPVFGALLSPEGGLVGPGALSKHVTGGVLGYHAIPHDGGGYLCRALNIGPGYEYIHAEAGLIPGNCERSPLKGQISGMAFWWRTLTFGFSSFLASAEPLEVAAEGVGVEVEPGEFAAGAGSSAMPAAEGVSPDGVLLNRAELSFLRALLGIEEEAAGSEVLAAGYDSLLKRGLIVEQPDGGYAVDDELVVLAAVASRPQAAVTAVTAAAEPDIVAAGEDPAAAPETSGQSAIRYYEWEDAIVELTYPDGDHVRLAAIQDRAQQVARLQSIFGLEAAELGIAADPVEVEASAAGAVDAWSQGSGVGAIRVERFADDQLLEQEEYQVVPGGPMTWLISGDPGQPATTTTLPATAGGLLEVVASEP